MKSLILLSFIAVNVTAFAATKSRRMTCHFDRNYYGAMAEVIQHSTDDKVDWISAKAYSTGGETLPLEFTRALSNLGFIKLGEFVARLEYRNDMKNCTTGVSALDVQCNERLGQMELKIRSKDSDGTFHDRVQTVETSTLEANSSKSPEGSFWMWEFTKDGKWDYTGSLKLDGCMYGESSL